MANINEFYRLKGFSSKYKEQNKHYTSIDLTTNSIKELEFGTDSFTGANSVTLTMNSALKSYLEEKGRIANNKLDDAEVTTT